MQGTNASFSGAGVVGWREILWLILIIQIHRNFWYPGKVWHHSGERIKGTYLLNKLVYLFSFWFCRIEFWQDPREPSAGEKNLLIFCFSLQHFPAQTLQNGLAQLCRLLQLPLFLSGLLVPHAPGSVRFLQFFYFSLKPSFFNFSLLFTTVISFKLFPFLPFPPIFSYPYHFLLLSSSTAMFWKASWIFEYGCF